MGERHLAGRPSGASVGAWLLATSRRRLALGVRLLVAADARGNDPVPAAARARARGDPAATERGKPVRARLLAVRGRRLSLASRPVGCPPPRLAVDTLLVRVDAGWLRVLRRPLGLRFRSPRRAVRARPL